MMIRAFWFFITLIVGIVLGSEMQIYNMVSKERGVFTHQGKTYYVIPDTDWIAILD